MKSKQVVELLCGPIASGKSSYSKKKALEGYIIINDDAIVNAIHCNHYGLYSVDLKPLYKGIENTALHTALALGKSVIIDRPNYSKAMRRRYIAIASSLDVPVVAVKFEDAGAKEHASRRVKSDNRGGRLEYWMEVYEAHKKLYEEPSLDEGLSGIIIADTKYFLE